MNTYMHISMILILLLLLQMIIVIMIVIMIVTITMILTHTHTFANPSQVLRQRVKEDAKRLIDLDGARPPLSAGATRKTLRISISTLKHKTACKTLQILISTLTRELATYRGVLFQR